MEDDKKPKPVDVSKINMELMKLKVTDIPSLLEYAHSIGGFAIVPTQEGVIKSTAREAMKEQTEDQLAIIFEQMKTLANQVQQIKQRVHISDLIYGAKMSFAPVMGKIYYLYEDQNGERLLSLLSPKDWGSNLPYVYLAEVRLNADHTWKVLDSKIDIV